MTDEWEFRTARGRGTVAGGALRVENTLVGMVRKRWVGRETKGRLLFLVSTVTTLVGVGRLADTGWELAAGSAEPWQALALAAFAFVAVALARKVLRTRTVPLRHVRSAARVGDDRIRVTYAEGGVTADSADTDDLEIETLTGDDADEAVELLRLKGVRVEDSRGVADAAPTSISFRERLAKKVE